MRTLSAEAAIGQAPVWGAELKALGCKRLNTGHLSLSVKDANGDNVLTLTHAGVVGGLFTLYDTALIEWVYHGDTAVPRGRKGV